MYGVFLFCFVLLLLTQGYFYHWFLERVGRRGRDRERETSMWERHIDWLPPTRVPTGPGNEPAAKVGALDQNQNPEPFSPWANTLTSEPNQRGLCGVFLSCKMFYTYSDAKKTMVIYVRVHLGRNFKALRLTDVLIDSHMNRWGQEWLFSASWKPIE